jgi:hypothetical protein
MDFKSKPDGKMLNDLRDLVAKSVGGGDEKPNVADIPVEERGRLSPDMEAELRKLQSLFSTDNPEKLLENIFDTYMNDLEKP